MKKIYQFKLNLVLKYNYLYIFNILELRKIYEQ